MSSWGIDLWDQRDILEKHTSNGIDFLDKCAGFIKERVRIEQEYAKSLRRLVKQYQFKKKEEDDLPYTYQHAFKKFLQENDDFAGQREVISEEMHNNILKEMQKLSLESKTDRKKTLQKLTEHKTQLDQHHKQLVASKKKYDQASEDANTAFKQYDAAAQSLDLTKAQILKFQKTSQDKGSSADKAKEDYKSNLENFNSKQTLYYDGDMPQIINNDLQAPEENRVQKLSLYLTEYASLQQKVSPIISKCFEGMIDAAKLCEPAKDSQIVIERYKTGEMRPEDLDFEEHGKPPVNSSHKNKTSKPSMWNKKKEALSNENIANDYADLPPAQRKIKFNKAINSLQEQQGQLEKAKAGMLKIKETSEKFGGDIESIKGQIEANEKEMERVKSLLHQYQCYLAAAIEGDNARRNSRPISTEVQSHQVPATAPVDNNIPLPPPSPPIQEFDDDDDELRCSVLYDFSGSNDGEMTVYAGEELVVVDEDDGSGWTRVVRGEDEGYIPTSYVQRL